MNKSTTQSRITTIKVQKKIKVLGTSEDSIFIEDYFKIQHQYTTITFNGKVLEQIPDGTMITEYQTRAYPGRQDSMTNREGAHMNSVSCCTEHI